jgi:restriction endonuclease S subunit
MIDGDRGTNYPKKEDFSDKNFCLFLNTSNVREDGFKFENCAFISQEKDIQLRKGKLNRGDVVLTTRGTIGNIGIYTNDISYENIRINSGMLILRPDTQEKILSTYLFIYLQSVNFKQQVDRVISGSAQPQLPIQSLKQIKIPLPPLEIQQKIVDEIQIEQDCIQANKKLIQIFEQKIKDTIAKIWQSEDSHE